MEKETAIKQEPRKYDDQLIKKAIAYIKRLYRSDSGGHDADHTLRVWHLTQKILKEETGCDREIAELAALLHDADDHKLFLTRKNAHTRKFLESNKVPAERVDRICEVINEVSFSQNKGRRPQTPEGRAVQDADRLDAIGAIGIARAFAYGGMNGRPMKESIQHFHDKLLLLQDTMNTKAGRKYAAERHIFLEEYLRQLNKELAFAK